MPDEAREVIFPQGIPVEMREAKPAGTHEARPDKQPPAESPPEGDDAASTKAEAGLYSEAGVIEEQARKAQPLKAGENLLPVVSGTPSSQKREQESKM